MMNRIAINELPPAPAIRSAEAQAVRGETILCVSPRMWDSLWRDTQHIMSRLARDNRVLYFEPGRDPDKSVAQELVRNAPHFFRMQMREVAENLIVVPTPSSLPHIRRYLPQTIHRLLLPRIVEANAHILVRHIQQTMRALDVERPILWLYGPYEVGLIGHFGEKLVCYFNYDEFADFLGNERVRDMLVAYENRLCTLSDVVMTTSHAQWERRKPLNPETYFVPNGVDFELFQQALDDDQPLPQDIASIRHPIIGFAGWIGYHIDTELLCRIAEEFPYASLVLVGPDELPPNEARERLGSLSNVFFLGQKPRAELPDYLRAFDVALMPYSLTGHIRSAYPMKLHEYLAAGRAIVATDLPELYPYNEVVRVARDHEEFLYHVSVAMNDHSAKAIASRVAVARENTWDARVQQIYHILRTHLADEGETA